MKQFLAAHPRPPLSAAQKAAALKFAQCMRAHGVPHFPDPRFPAGGGIAIATPGRCGRERAGVPARPAGVREAMSEAVVEGHGVRPCSTAAAPVTASDRVAPPSVTEMVASATEQFSTTRPGPRGLA